MKVAVRCEDPGLAVRVLDLAQQDLQRVPHPDAPEEGAPNFVSGASEVVGGAECWVDVKGDPLLEDLYLQYVHTRAAVAGLPRDAVAEDANDSEDALTELVRPESATGAEVPGSAGQQPARLVWPDGSNGMVLTVALLAALPVQPQDVLEAYECSRDVLTVVVDLPARSDLKRRTSASLGWLVAQGATDLRSTKADPAPRARTWAWYAYFRMPGEVNGQMTLVKERGQKPRLTLRLESAEFTPYVNANRPNNGRRQLLFDATASGHRELRQRFDVQALMKGPIYRVEDDEAVTAAVAGLVELEYLVHTWDAAGWQDAQGMRLALAATMGLPERDTRQQLRDWLRELAVYGWGRTVSSFLHTGTIFALTGFADFADRCPAAAAELLDEFTLAARIGVVAGHPMLMVTATDPLDNLYREHSMLASYDPPYGPEPLFPPNS